MENPIGVFDSGVGGLTVVKQLEKILPNEKIIYFGDTGRVPYGTKSDLTIEQYAKQDMKFLLSKKVKMIVAACGTVSSIMSDKTDNFNFLYCDVVLPASKKACQVTKNQKVGVIGTKATIRSKSYHNAINKINQEIKVIGIDCPLFVPLVENGYIQDDNQMTTLVAKQYLQTFIDNKVDTLILGCTHFPIIKNIIQKILGDNVTLIDNGYETAFEVKNVLEKNHMLNQNSDENNLKQFFVSDDVDTFKQTANIFLDEKIKDNISKINIENF